MMHSNLKIGNISCGIVSNTSLFYVRVQSVFLLYSWCVPAYSIDAAHGHHNHIIVSFFVCFFKSSSVLIQIADRETCRL